MISLMISSHSGSSFFKTLPTMTGLVVAPLAPLSIAYCSSLQLQESFHTSVCGKRVTISYKLFMYFYFSFTLTG